MSWDSRTALQVRQPRRAAVPASRNSVRGTRLQADLDMLRAQGLVTAPVTAAQLVDASFAEGAVAHLGPYKRAMH